MSTYDKATGDNAQSPRPAAQQKQGSGITDKLGGVVNVIHGTGEVIRGHALDTADIGHSNDKGKTIIAAGKDEVERGLKKIEGKSAATSAAGGHASNGGGVGDDTGAAPPSFNPNTPQVSTAAQRAETARGYAEDTGYPADKGAAANGGYGAPGRTSEKEQFASTVLPRDRPIAADYPSVQQRDIDVRQQGATDGDKGTRTTADAQYPTNAARQPSGTAFQA